MVGKQFPTISNSCIYFNENLNFSIMRILLFFILIGSLNGVIAQEKEQPLKNLFNEFHASVNHGIPLFMQDRTFFGVGLGANKVFRSDKIVAFRTGLELQLFHSWQANGDPSHFSYTENIHSYFLDLSVPLALRMNINHLFVEVGGNIGVGVGGQRRETYSSFPLGQPTVTTEQKTKTGSGFWLGPAVGIGTLISLNERLDLLIRPDVQLNWQIYDGLNLYARLCVGIHLK